MSNTRHAEPGSDFRPERYASSYDLGLPANLVAKCCAELHKSEDERRYPTAAPTLWFIQWLSWEWGLRVLAERLLASNHPVFDEWRSEKKKRDIKLWLTERDLLMDVTEDLRPSNWKEQVREAVKRAREFMNKPISFWKIYEDEVVKELRRMCLQPGWYGGHTFDAADAYRANWTGQKDSAPQTTVGRRIADALRYTRDTRCLTLIDGPARIGKSFAVRQWCHRSGGLARYVQVPSGNADRNFFTEIATALGLCTSRDYKADEIRQRIEDTLAVGDLMLVLDEAHYLWPQNWQRYAMPSRVNWLMTALVNRGVPVALVTTPQFYHAQTKVERNTGWTSEQFIGRIGHFERLPDRLEIADLRAVAKSMLPHADAKAIEAVAQYAGISKRHLAAIEGIAKRANWHASQNSRPDANAADVRRAMKESIIPTDKALVEALADARHDTRRRSARTSRVVRGTAATVARLGFEDLTRRQPAPEMVTG